MQGRLLEPTLLLLLFALAVVLRAVLAVATPSLYPDGAVELEQAARYAAGRWSEGIALRFHPLYGLAVAGVARLVGAGLEVTAEVLVVVASALVAPASAATAALLAPPDRRRACAFAAGVLAATHPYLVRLGGQVMAYGFAHAALAGALLLTTAAVARGSRAAALGAGGCVGLGFLARADGVTSGAGLGLALLLAALGPARGTRLGRAALPLLFAAGAVAAMSPYLVAMRLHSGEWRLSLKKRVGDLVRVRTGGAPQRRPPPPPTAASLRELILLEEAGGDRREAAPAAPPPLGRSATYALRVVLAAAHPPVYGAALVGLVLLWAPRRGGASSPRAPPAAALLAGPLALVMVWLAQTLLKANAGYTSRIHASAAAVLVAPLAGCGLVLLAHGVARVGGWRRRRLAAGLLAVVAAAHLPKALEPQRVEYAGEAALGRRLRRLAGPGPLVVCGRDARVVAHYADAAYLDVPPGPPGEALAAARARGAAFLVVFLRSHGPRPGRLERALAEQPLERLEGAQVERPPDLRYEWLVYRWE